MQGAKRFYNKWVLKRQPTDAHTQSAKSDNQNYCRTLSKEKQINLALRGAVVVRDDGLALRRWSILLAWFFALYIGDAIERGRKKS